jgi:ribonuclease HII
VAKRARRDQIDLFEIGMGMGDAETWASASGYVDLLGVDEAGRGPLAGPVVVAAVTLDLEGARREGWLPLLNDSKQVELGVREELFDRIRATAVRCAVEQAEPWEIDRYNILQATLRAMRRAVGRALAGRAGRPLVLVDGNTPIPELGNQRTLVRGDGRSFHVAAASILAKVARDRVMARYDERWPLYGFGGHKGYPTASHRRSVLAHGPCPGHRRSFKVTDPDLDDCEAGGEAEG